MKVLCFKIHQNRPINEKYDFLGGGRSLQGVMRPLCINFYLNIGKHMKMLRFKFHQNRTINEKFDFFEEGGEEPREVEGSLYINFYLDYYWRTYEKIMFQISSKLANK